MNTLHTRGDARGDARGEFVVRHRGKRNFGVFGVFQ